MTLTLVEPLALPGDFNHDGAVDAADYTVWRNGLGTTYTHADYDVWLSNFGRASAAAPPGAVPEPAAMLASLIAVGAGALARRRG